MTDTSLLTQAQGPRTRRAWVLLTFGLIIPGSAQAIYGLGRNRRFGRFALKLWLVVVALVVVIGLLLLTIRAAMIGLLATGWVLKIVAVAAIALAVFWLILAADTIVMVRPSGLGRRRGVVFSIVAIVVSASLAIATAAAGQAAWVTGGSLSTIFAGGGQTDQNHGRYNLLLLGADSGSDREGLRPDSITLASVSADTGRTVLFSLPRNMQRVPFIDSSPLHALYPDGYYCESMECMLNAVYLLGQEHASLYPGVADPGMQATIEAVEGLTGLSVNYDVMIDLQGFVDLIDAMGGITMDINDTIPIEPISGWSLQPGPNQHLNGTEALWFGRSRYASDDYDRMARQKCLMAAMLRQLNPTTVATKFAALAAASSETIMTSIPSSQIAAMASLALKAKALPIISVAFVPPFVSSAHPDVAFLQQTVTDTIAQSEALDAAATAAPASPATGQPTAPATPGGDATAPTTDGNPDVTDDLDAICAAH